MKSLESKILDIISNDEIYLRYVSKFTSNDGPIELLYIPNNSFIANSLDYNSITDLSDYMKTTFIGPIPNIWSTQQQYVLFKLMRNVKVLSRNRYIRQAIFNERRYFYGINIDPTITDEKFIKEKIYSTLVSDDNSRTLGSLQPHIGFTQYKKKLKKQNQNHKLKSKYLKRCNQLVSSISTNKSKDKLLCQDRAPDKSSSTTLVNDKYNNSFICDTELLDLSELSTLYTPIDYSTNIKSDIKKDSRKQYYEQQQAEFYAHIESPKRLISLKLMQPKPQLTVDEVIQDYPMPTLEENGVSRKSFISSTNISNNNRETLSNKKNGEILFSEEVLVLIKNATDTKIPSSKLFNNEPFDTVIKQRWKHYFMIVQSIPSKKTLAIQLSRTFKKKKQYQISTLDKLFFKKLFEFHIDDHSKVSLYNLIDDTICIQRPVWDIKDGKIHLKPICLYVLKCRSKETAFRLYSILTSRISYSKYPKIVPVVFPNIKLSITIKSDIFLIKCIKFLSYHDNNTKKIVQLPKGYRLLGGPLRRFFNILMIEKTKKLRYNFTPSIYNSGLFLRIQEELQWFTDRNMEKLWKLYPLTRLCPIYILEQEENKVTEDDNKVSSIQYKNIEGFALEIFENSIFTKHSKTRITSKMNYIFNAKNLLFFTPSPRATLPLSSKILTDYIGYPEDMKLFITTEHELTGNILNVDPILLNDLEHIELLSKETKVEQFFELDYYAYKCFCRRLGLVLNSTSCIDLTDIKDIFIESPLLTKRDITYEAKLRNFNKTFFEQIDYQDNILQCVLVLRNFNNHLVKLLVPSPSIARQWMVELTKLRDYWKQISNEQLQSRWDQKYCDINRELTKITSPPNISIIKYCGMLFEKSGKHNTFTKFFVILIPGFLLLYKYNARSFRGYVKANIKYILHLMIPLKHGYIYSGKTKEDDLSKRNRVFDLNNLSHDTMPRVYKDGWRSSEEDLSRAFILQHTSYYVKQDGISNHEYSSNMNNGYFSSIRKLYFNYLKQWNYPNSIKRFNEAIIVNRRKWIFLARSSQERDIWISTISKEIERIN